MIKPQLPLLIGLYSSAPRCGKTTTADYLVKEFDYIKVSFASPIKAMVTTLLLEMGLDGQDASEILEKKAVVPVINVSTRHLLQTLGTEWGRTCISPHVWVEIWAEKVKSLLAQGYRVVVDDMRFVNEAGMVRRLGGVLWQIKRSSSEASIAHSSEGQLDTYPLFDHLLENNGGVDELFEAITKAVMSDHQRWVQEELIDDRTCPEKVLETR